ncbi:hypothetical protein E1B28_013605 [Marasmius oreades]|uniref:DNA (cytosine-5-)-methyltransferase n=1 Tax=Marasmius oreades TaxID=181124 RepID=A0A9P7RQ61_9AGAR|nr:uncharacterized protein E1B28_013605 [Marasmius oreades]KAG7087657.1 hypothetical protein E1B28_013605 [Marasmius oreades]
MKVGILALVRNEHEVLYFTAGERWRFEISSRFKWAAPDLRAIITHNTAHNNTAGLRVTVKNMKQSALDKYFDGILFLHPPPPDTVLQARHPTTAGHGYICTGERYLSKLYCKGLFVFDYREKGRQETSDEESDSDDSEDGATSPARNGLHYGYNFLRDLKLGRDRDIPSSTSVAELVSNLWMDLLAEEVNDIPSASFNSINGSQCATASLANRFLDLFELAPHCLDISDARWFFGKKYGAEHAGRVVSHLWATYLSRKKKEHDGATIWVYDHRKDDSEEQQKIIRSLGMISISPPDGLFNLFKDYKLTRTPDEEQKRRFKLLDASTSFEGKFSAHVRHLVSVARDCQANLRGRPCQWKHAQAVDATASQSQHMFPFRRCQSQPTENRLEGSSQGVSSSSFELDVFISEDTLFLNDRNLSFDYVHSEGKGGSTSCPAFDSTNDTDLESIVCDCSVQDLVNQIVQDCNLKASKKQLSGHLRDMNNVFLLFPRNLSFLFRSLYNSHAHPVETTLTWTTHVHDALNFVVKVCPGQWTLQHTIEDPDIMLNEAVTGDKSSEGQGYPDGDHEIGNKEVRDEHVHEADAERTTSEQDAGSDETQILSQAENGHERAESVFLTTVDPSITLSNLDPGQTYTVQVCARRPTRVAYSVPTLLQCPLDRVQTLSANVTSNVLEVSFEQVTNAVKYLVTLCFSDDHKEEFETKSVPWFYEMDGSDSSIESIAVVGVSSGGIQSYEARTAKPIYVTPPARAAVDNESDASSPTDNDLGGIQNYEARTEKPEKPIYVTATIDYESDASSSADNDLDYVPESDGEFEDDGDFVPEMVIEGYQSHKAGVASQHDYRSLGSLDLHGRSIKQGDVMEVHLRKSHAADRGRRFLHFLLYINEIWERRKTNKTELVLQCRQYLSEHDFKDSSLGQDPTAFVSYRDLSANDREVFLILHSDGEQSVDILVDDIAKIISVYDEHHGREPPKAGHRDDNLGSFHCSWALGLHSKAQFLTPLLDDYLPPKPPKPRSLGVADFFCGAGGFSLGFSDAGWDPQLAVDSNIHACNTFKMNHPTTDIHYTKVETFLTEKHYIYRPPPSCAVALISPPCQGFSSANPGGKNDEENRKGLAICSRIAETLNAHHVLIENVPGSVLVTFHGT